MPFATQNTLDPNPSFRIFFIGLNILAPAAGNTCQVFVHNSSPPHNVSIETRRKRPGGKPDVLMMRHLGKLHSTGVDPNNGFLIRTGGLAAGQKGVKAYNGSVASPEGTKLADAFSIEKITGVAADVEPAGGLPGILIDHGVFYTADKVTVRAKIKKNNGEEMELAEVPTILGANIYLDPNVSAHRVQLMWRQQGSDVNLTLRPSQHFTYEIYIINEPLFVPDSASPLHGEFTEYFKILRNIPHQKKFELEFLEPVPDRGSNRSPCMSILLDNEG